MVENDISDKWQQRWAEAKVFETKAEPGKQKFFITVPYPYISGSLHIGHARAVTEADVYARYQRMTGMNTLYPMAFHISGTPVLGISLAIKNGDEKKIELYTGYVRQYVKEEAEIAKIIQSFIDPEKIVEFFIPRMQEEFKTLGLSIDWRRSFTSGDFDHQALVEWQFHKYKSLGYLKQGSYPILYSLSLRNAVGEDDIAQGDTDPVELQEFTLIKFKLEDAYLVAATLRPETMYGQTNMWVNPSTTYVRARVGDEQWIISRECAEKLSSQEHRVHIESEVPGKMLIGKTCHAPFVEREIPILPSAHCDPDIGTGIVTSVPSDAPFDYIALKELQDSEKFCTEQNFDHALALSVKPIPIIASKGYSELSAVDICQMLGITNLSQESLLAQATQDIYKTGFHTGIMLASCGPYAGMTVQQAKEAMKQKLFESGSAEKFYEVSRKAKSRDGGKVIVAVLEGQWFLDYNAPGWKDNAQKALDGMEIWPEKYRQQFEDVFAWLDKRPCARRRGLGTKLPFDEEWIIESLSDSTAYMALYPIAHILREHEVTKAQLTPTFFDFIMNATGTAQAVADETGIPMNVLNEMRQEWQYWYPFDQRHTYTPHLSNHLSFMIFAHAACFDESRYPRRISFHGLVMSEGEKMSKSKGNVISLLDIKERFGADAFRALMCSSTSIDGTFNWQTEAVELIQRQLEILTQTIMTIQADKGEGVYVNPAFVSKTERAIQRASEALGKMDLRTYSMIVLYEMLNNYKHAARNASEEEKKAVHYYISDRWIIMLAPLVPHLAEELWSKDKNKSGFVSVAPWPISDESKISDLVELDEEYIEEIISNIRKNAQLKGEQPQKIELFQAQQWKYEFVDSFRKHFATIKNPGQLSAELLKETLLASRKEDVAKLTQAVFKNQKLLPIIDRTHAQEMQLLEKAVTELRLTFNCDVMLGDEECSENAKAKNGLPGKPAVVWI